MRLLALRKKHPEFIYEDFALEERKKDFKLSFSFSLRSLLKDDPLSEASAKALLENHPFQEKAAKIFFSPEILMPSPKVFDKEKLANFAFHLGLVETISYWKAACPSKLIVKPAKLKQGQIEFWQDLYRYGLGEFFYENKIDFRGEDFLKIISLSKKKLKKVSSVKPLSGALILVGGGKDSAVTLELLKNWPGKKQVLLLNPTPAALKVVSAAGFDKPLIVKRKIDPKLLALNKRGYLNGHTPFSSYLAFLGILVAWLYGYKYVIASNERGAGEGSLRFHNLLVNHQYSKSFRFEKLFRRYCRLFISKEIEYFSFLRPLYELQIAGLFAKLPKVHSLFVSCNRKRGRFWCRACPKCAFVYLALSSFLPEEKMREIFGVNLFEKKEMRKEFLSLVGLGKHKPLECVGTIAESRMAVGLSVSKYQEEGKNPPSFLLALYKRLKIKEGDVKRFKEKVKTDWGRRHFLPVSFQGLGLLRLKSVLILGYGREGRAVHRFLREKYPRIKIGIADKKRIKPLFAPAKLYTGSNYLKSFRDWETIILSPGINPNLAELKKAKAQGKKITSATNIFFSQCPGRIIGVTGTKGKSTTASLIACILKKKYPDVRLLGNIGRPALDFLAKADKKTIFVMELSSFQLESVFYSPSVAVFLNIFPEHLNRYLSFADYVKSKARIVKYQKPSDLVIFNPHYKMVKKLIEKSPGRKHRFGLRKGKETDCFVQKGRVWLKARKGKEEAVLRVKEIPLLGEGNLENVLAACLAAALLNVPVEKIRQGVVGFKPLPHRLELVGKFAGIYFYNDSLATVPEATIASLKALGEKVQTLILGGFERGLDYSELGEFLVKRKGLRTLILFPETGERIWQKIEEAACGRSLPFIKRETSSMRRAVEIAFSRTGKGKVCLLSPASASFNLFRDYAQRGNVFKRLVKKFGGEGVVFLKVKRISIKKLHVEKYN